MVVTPSLVTFSDGLAISATVLSLTAIGFGVAFFIVQTQQLYRGQKESADYVGEMKEVLGKIEGLTVGTRDQLQGQFDRVLNAALSGQATATPKPTAANATGDEAGRDATSSALEFRRARLRQLISRPENRRVVELLSRGGVTAEKVIDPFLQGQGTEATVRAAISAMITMGQLIALDLVKQDKPSGEISLKTTEGWVQDLLKE